MDSKFMRKFLLGMMLVIFILHEVQIDSEIPNHPVPVPIPLVHITKRKKLPLLFHDCVEYEREKS